MCTVATVHLHSRTYSRLITQICLLGRIVHVTPPGTAADILEWRARVPFRPAN